MNAPCKHAIDCRDADNVFDHVGVGNVREHPAPRSHPHRR